MIKIESLKDYIHKTNKEEFINLATKIYEITDFISKDYPNYKKWYFTKQLPEIITEKRNILFIRNPQNYDEIISMACLKKDNEERKICTLYVAEKYRNLKIGSQILKESMIWLKTTKPLITFPNYKLDMFAPLIKKYNWELTEIIEGLYNNKTKKLCFNGTLTKTNTQLIEKSITKHPIKKY